MVRLGCVFLARLCITMALPISVREGPPENASSCTQRRHTRQVRECWGASANAAVKFRRCCEQRGAATAGCWDWAHTRARCCLEGVYKPRALRRRGVAQGTTSAGARCNAADESFLEHLTDFYQVGRAVPAGSLPHRAAATTAARPGWRRLAGLLGMRPSQRPQAWNLDAEMGRCAASTLTQLALLIEMVVAGEERESVQELLAFLWRAMGEIGLLFATARNSGLLPFSLFRWPNLLVSDAVTRITYLGRLLRAGDRMSQEILAAFGFHLHSNATDCFALSPTGKHEVCQRLFMQPATNALVRLLATPLHTDAFTSRSPLSGRDAVVLCQLLLAAGLDGLRRKESRAFLDAASAELSRAPPRRDVRLARLQQLQFAAQRLREAMDGNVPMKYAQNDQDQHLPQVLKRLGGPWRRTFVEIGVGNGMQCNTRHLRQNLGWTGVMIDQIAQNEEIGLHRRLVSAENINAIFDELGVPHEPDLLSIDVDSNDFWLWRALDSRFRPRLVIIEANFRLGDLAVATRYAPGRDLNFVSEEGQNIGVIGSSLSAVVALAESKGYRLVDTDPMGDSIFAREDLVSSAAELQVAVPTSGAWDEWTAARYEAPAARKAYTQALVASRHFHVTAEEVLRSPADSVTVGLVDERWTEQCLTQAFEDICSPERGPSFCFSTR